MAKLIGIRREDKNEWERRVPIIPKHVEYLKSEYGIETIVQPFPNRAYTDQEYLEAGAKISENLNECPVILAVKEIPVDLLFPQKTYLFFSHTIKGQAYNMPLLKKILALNCTLVDYECIKNSLGARLVFFGRYAGLAGMIDALALLGQRMKVMGFDSPLSALRSAYQYRCLDDAMEHIHAVGKKVLQYGLPKRFAPYVFGFTGYGRVSTGSQEIFNLLPHIHISPEELPDLKSSYENHFYKVIFKEEHMVKPKHRGHAFDLDEYYTYPEAYRPRFTEFLPYLTILINGIYWEEKYPRLVTKSFLKKQQSAEKLKLLVIGDISCDINGAIECTEKVTTPDKPAFVYNALKNKIIDGVQGEGVVIMAVDNLPAELPRDASRTFSETLWQYVPELVEADFSQPMEKLKLSQEIKKAMIVKNGQLTPDYQYMSKYLE